MHKRLVEIIKYKTGGKQSEFGKLVGWSPQYITRLLNGEAFGLNPVMTIITKFPEINVRWLLLGEGEMIDSSKYSDIRKIMHKNMFDILDAEKYMIVMSLEELRDFELIVKGEKTFDFSPDTVWTWSKLLQSHNNNLTAKFKAASSKSKRICKQKIVKE